MSSNLLPTTDMRECGLYTLKSVVYQRSEMTGLQKLCQLVVGKLPPQAIRPEEWPLLADIADEHHLSPFLGWLLNQNRLSLSGDLHEKVKADYRQAASRFLLLQNAQLAVTRALNAAGIPHMWLKGIVLAASVYPDGALRPMGDLDVLVAYEQRQAALDCLLDNGYGYDKPLALFDPNALAMRDQSHHYVLRGGPGNAVTVELHFRLMGQKGDLLFPPEQLEWFRRQTSHYAVGNNLLVAPTAEAHLLYLCGHMVLQHGLHDFVLTRALDLHYLAETPSLGWDSILQKAVELGWTHVVEQALQHARDLFDTEIPAAFAQGLRQHRPLDGHVQHVALLSNRGAPFEQARWTLRNLTLKERIDWIWKVAFPHRDYMRQRYRIPEGQLVWPYYLHRWRTQLQKAIVWIRLRHTNHK